MQKGLLARLCSMEKVSPDRTKTDILRRWYKEVWEDGRLEVIDGYFLDAADNTHNAGEHLVPNFGVDPNELREWLTIVHSFVTDIRVEILHSIEEGDWMSAMLEITCRPHDRREPIRVIQQIMLRFEGTKKAESYPAFDFIRFFEQLGQLPEHTHALLLSGTKLH